MKRYLKHPIDYQIQINLVRDFRYFLSNQLLQYGVKVPPDDSKVILKFFELQRRVIAKRPRKVLISKDFSYPPEIAARVMKLIRKIESGESLLPHLSRKFLDPNFHDALLNDWGIHHLHLGTEIDNDGFVNRNRSDFINDYLLFLRITDKHAYLIKIGKHGEWANKTLFEILHKYWPDSISQYRIVDGLSIIGNEPTEKERMKLRKSGAITLTSVNDKAVYYPVGGGYATSQNSLEAVRQSHYYSNMLTYAEINIKSNISHIYISLKRLYSKVDKSLNFQLFIFGSKFYVWETNSNIFICLTRNRAWRIPLSSNGSSTVDFLRLELE
ncbi:hypothetical protein AB1K83_05700 [Sporosarcina sp. 179-K 3D1 HS]|uniref:hypothetical protein n=1 Tax=Sporosarcina sp. 179-K 3D1 HS TaxID=3232169 RepID=UPI0039A2BF2C